MASGWFKWGSGSDSAQTDPTATTGSPLAWVKGILSRVKSTQDTVGATTDAAADAGGEGTVSAKLRRATGTLGATTDAPASASVDEDATARSSISLLKGIKNLFIDLFTSSGGTSIRIQGADAVGANLQAAGDPVRVAGIVDGSDTSPLKGVTRSLEVDSDSRLRVADDVLAPRVGATTDAAATAGGEGSLSAKLRHLSQVLGALAKGEDTEHVDGDLGMQALAVSRTSPASGMPALTAGDYASLLVTEKGLLYVNAAANLNPADGVANSANQIAGPDGVGRMVIAGSLVFNGTTWDRERPTWKSASPADGSANTHAYGFADTGGNARMVGVGPHLFNGTTWDRHRGNERLAGLASAERTVATTTPDLTNYNGRGATVLLDITVAAAGSIAEINILAKGGGSQYDTIATWTGLTLGVGCHAFQLAPGSGSAAGWAAAPLAGMLPRTFAVQVVPTNANAVTYRVDIDVQV